MDTIPVTLIVKAPNQQFEDQTIKCELSWTIKKLKGYLSEVYPCKPSTEEQKLIYSGQLLHDAVVLKDVLRQYEGQETHTVHLVFTPKMKSPINKSPAGTTATNGSKKTTNEIDAEGLRHRKTTTTKNTPGTNQDAIQTEAATEAAQQQQNITASSTASPLPPAMMVNNVPFPVSQQGAGFIAAQQLAYQNWMQQTYVQYLNQYMNLMSAGMTSDAMFMQQQANFQNLTNFHQPNPNTVINPPVLQGFQFPQQLFSQSQQQELEQQQQQLDTMSQEQPVVVAPQPENPPEPRYPNLIRDDPQDNRDWLDTFYSMGRLLILLTLVYFYSSPVRCLVVVAIGVSIYLYHIGFFRPAVAEANNNHNLRPANQQNNNNIQLPNNNQINANNDLPADAPVNQGQNAVIDHPENVDLATDATLPSAQPVPIVAASDATAIAASASGNDPTQEQTSGTSVIAFIRTFVLSFFASLIPEAPAL